MKAVQINRYGGIEVIEINENASKPAPAKDQVLVEVHAAGINPVDWKLREGYLKERMPLEFPATLGGDFSGVVVELGGDVSGVKIGDEVYGQAGILNGGSGSFAEFASANTSKISAKPKSIDHIQAGALPLVGVSALQAIDDHIKLKKGQKILIHGGGGGIGSIAIQIAKAHGAYVAATVSAANKKFVLSLGADEVIDYKTQAFELILKDFDAVFDASGADTQEKSFNILKNGGIFVSMSAQPNLTLASKKGITAMRQGTDGNPERLSRLASYIDHGTIKAHVDKVFPLDGAKEAFSLLEKGSPKGKVVLKIS